MCNEGSEMNGKFLGEKSLQRGSRLYVLANESEVCQEERAERTVPSLVNSSIKNKHRSKQVHQIHIPFTVKRDRNNRKSIAHIHHDVCFRETERKLRESILSWLQGGHEFIYDFNWLEQQHKIPSCPVYKN